MVPDASTSGKEEEPQGRPTPISPMTPEKNDGGDYMGAGGTKEDRNEEGEGKNEGEKLTTPTGAVKKRRSNFSEALGEK